MFFIIAILIIIIMDEYTAVSIWLMAVLALDMSVRDERTKPIIYLEVIEDYPIEDCIKPEKFKFLFKKLNTLSYKDIPKEMYFSSIAEYIGFWIYTVLGLIVFLKSSYMASMLGIIYFVVVYAIIGIGSCFAMVRKSFLVRYKLLNWHNFKYFFNGKTGPYPKKIGHGEVVEKYRRGRKEYAVVRMIETGELKKRVLLQNGKSKNENHIYDIYEICKVYYIV